MGSDSTRHSVKCRCNKKVKKSEKVPQRGPGVAELEKILGNNPPQPPPFSGFYFPLREYFCRPTGGGGTGEFSNMIKYQQSQEANNSDLNFGLSFTQLMTIDYNHPMFQLAMNSVCPVYPFPTANPRFDSFSQHSPSQKNYIKCGLDKIQQGQPSMEHDEAPTVSEQGNMMVMKNAAEGSTIQNMNFPDKATLSSSLRPPSRTEHSSLPRNPILDNSSESQEGRQVHIFGFNLEGKEVSMDTTNLSLSNNDDDGPSVVQNLDLELKL